MLSCVTMPAFGSEPCFDQFNRRPGWRDHFAQIVSGVLGRGDRPLVIADRVVQHAIRPLGHGYPDALASHGHIFDRRVDQGARFGLPTG